MTSGNFGLGLAIASCVLYCLNGELLQALQEQEGHHASPLLNLLLCHLGGLLFIPRFGRFTLPESMTAVKAETITFGPKTSALFFAFLIMGYNYAWLLSTSYVELSLTNAIFQLSVALVYLCSIYLFAEAVSLDRVVGVLLSVLGSFLASGGLPSGGSSSSTMMGGILALLAAGGYTAYQVLFRWSFGHLKSDVAFLAHFGAWVSIWHVLVILPLVWAADVLGYERLQWPSGQLVLLGTICSALVAFTVNALYLCIVMWGSPMLLPSTSALSVPFTVLLDIMLHGAQPDTHELFGQMLVLLSVVLIMQQRNILSFGITFTASSIQRQRSLRVWCRHRTKCELMQL